MSGDAASALAIASSIKHQNPATSIFCTGIASVTTSAICCPTHLDNVCVFWLVALVPHVTDRLPRAQLAHRLNILCHSRCTMTKQPIPSHHTHNFRFKELRSNNIRYRARIMQRRALKPKHLCCKRVFSSFNVETVSTQPLCTWTRKMSINRPFWLERRSLPGARLLRGRTQTDHEQRPVLRYLPGQCA